MDELKDRLVWNEKQPILKFDEIMQGYFGFNILYANNFLSY